MAEQSVFRKVWKILLSRCTSRNRSFLTFKFKICSLVSTNTFKISVYYVSSTIFFFLFVLFNVNGNGVYFLSKMRCSIQYWSRKRECINHTGCCIANTSWYILYMLYSVIPTFIIECYYMNVLHRSYPNYRIYYDMK